MSKQLGVNRSLLMLLAPVGSNMLPSADSAEVRVLDKRGKNVFCLKRENKCEKVTLLGIMAKLNQVGANELFKADQ